MITLYTDPAAEWQDRYKKLARAWHDESKRLTSELATERKRLDWVLDEMGLVELRNLLFLHWDCQVSTLRAAIDAAMRADTDASVSPENTDVTT